MPTTRATELAQVGSLVSADPSASTVTVSGSVVTNAGTAAAPAIVPTGDTNTGIFFPAADTIAFSEGGTEAMRIDSSGNVLVGATSITGLTPSSAAKTLVLNSTDANLSGAISYVSNGTIKAYHYVDSDGLLAHQVVSNNGQKFYTNNTERLRIDSSGRVGIGTTSPLKELQINATEPTIRLEESSAGSKRLELSVNSAAEAKIFANQSGGTLILGTVGTERLRIDSSGRVLIARSTADLGTVGYRFDTTGEMYASINLATNSAITYGAYSTSASAYRFYVGMAGTVFATNTTISAISDIRYKENIRDLNVGLESIMALRPRVFDWKDGKGKNIKNDRGFIAQEFEQVFPDLIDEWKDDAPQGEEPYKSVRQDLIPVLVKAIQELKSKNDILEAKVAALEAA